MENYKKKCPHCGSTSTLPIAYGLMSDEAHQENAKEEKYVWGGCVICIDSSPSDYCNNCKKSFGGVIMKRPKKSQSTIKEMALNYCRGNNMKNEDFDDLYNDLNTGLYSDRQMFMHEFAAIYLDKKDKVKFLSWLTEKTQMRYIDPQEVKGIQNIINKSATQRLMLELTEKDKLTQRVRLMRANKPLLHKGLCTQSEINAKEYLFVVEDLNSHIYHPNKPIKKKEVPIDYINIDDDLRELMLPLERVEMEIVILRFGLHKDKPISLEKISKRLGKSREWTRKRLNNALEKMKVNS